MKLFDARKLATPGPLPDAPTRHADLEQSEPEFYRNGEASRFAEGATQ